MITIESASAYHEWLMLGPQTAKSPSRSSTKLPVESSIPKRPLTSRRAVVPQAALRSGTFVEPSRRTVGSYLLEEWLPDNQPSRLRPSSFANYTIYTRTHAAVLTVSPHRSSCTCWSRSPRPPPGRCRCRQDRQRLTTGSVRLATSSRIAMAISATAWAWSGRGSGSTKVRNRSCAPANQGDDQERPALVAGAYRRRPAPPQAARRGGCLGSRAGSTRRIAAEATRTATGQRRRTSAKAAIVNPSA